MAPKQFHAPREKRPPLEFEITYTRMAKDGEWEDETEKFRARSVIPGSLMLRMGAAIEKSTIGVQASEVLTLLHASIWPEDSERFDKLINDPDVAIPIETLGEILEWLIEEYAERPTQYPSP